MAEKELKSEKVESVKAEETKTEKVYSGNYIMRVTHLSWGKDGKSHFYAEKKPEINAKVMGKYADTLKIWLKAGWIEKGSYK